MPKLSHRLGRRRFLGRSLLAAPALVLARPVQAQLRRITIGANPAGTNFNLVAGGFARTLQSSLGVPCIVRPYAGSSVYIPLLHRGEIPLGINSSLDSYLAFTGQPPYAAALQNLRGLMAVYPLGYMFWGRASSDLRRVEDLRRRRVVLDYRSLVPLGRLNRAILATAGLGENDVERVTAAGLAEGARLVLEGRADAVAMGYRLPLVQQMHAALPGGLRFLQMGGDEERVAAVMPGAWVETVLPDEATAGLSGPTRVAMYDTFLNAGTHVSQGDAYRVVSALRAQWEALRDDYAVLAPVPARNLASANAPHPYHPGAVAYFREAGMWSAAHEANQKRVLAETG